MGSYSEQARRTPVVVATGKSFPSAVVGVEIWGAHNARPCATPSDPTVCLSGARKQAAERRSGPLIRHQIRSSDLQQRWNGVQDGVSGKDRLATLGQVEQTQATLEEARAACAALARELGMSAVVRAESVSHQVIYERLDYLASRDERAGSRVHAYLPSL